MFFRLPALVFFSFFVLTACKLVNKSSKISADDQEPLPPSGCAEAFSDENRKNACETVFAKSYPQIKADSGPLLNQQIRQLLGDPVVIKHGNNCLTAYHAGNGSSAGAAEKAESVHFVTCRDGQDNDHHTWYIASMEAESTIENQSKAMRVKLFYLINRASVKEWLQTPLSDHKTKKPEFKCVDFWNLDGVPGENPVNPDTALDIPLKLSPCSKTRLMFTSMNNWENGDINHSLDVMSEYLFAFDLNAPADQNPFIWKFREEMAKRKPILSQPCDHPGCISAANNYINGQPPTRDQVKAAKKALIELMETPVNLGGLHWLAPDKKYTFILRPHDKFGAAVTRVTDFSPQNIMKYTGNSGMMVGGCTPQNYTEDKPCFVETDGSLYPVYLSKSILGMTIDLAQGPVIQLVDNNKNCATWNAGSKGCRDPSIDVADGDTAGQFRLLFVPPPPDATDNQPRVKLQRVVNLTLLPRDQNGRGMLPPAPKCFGIRQTNDGIRGEEVNCCSDTNQQHGNCTTEDTYIFDQESKTITVPNPNGGDPTPDRKLGINFCINASSNDRGLQYDCATPPPPSKHSHLKRMQDLATGLSVIPVFGNLAAAGVYAHLCHIKSYDQQTHEKVCNEIGVQVALFINSTLCWVEGPLTLSMVELAKSELISTAGNVLKTAVNLLAENSLLGFAVGNAAKIVLKVMSGKDLLVELLKTIAKADLSGVAKQVTKNAFVHSANQYGIDSNLLFSNEELNVMIDAANYQIEDTTAPQCNYDNAAANNGWGYDPVAQNGDNCPPLNGTDETPGSTNCNYDNAAANNGWGYDPVARNGDNCPPR